MRTTALPQASSASGAWVRDRTDLLLALAAASALIADEFLVGSPAVTRTLLGLLFILFLPGYALIAAVFPKGERFGVIERLALSFGLSFATVACVGLGLNQVPRGIDREPFLLSIYAVIAVALAVALVRRPPGRAQAAAGWRRRPVVLTALAVGALVVVGAALIIVANSTRGEERFTEFYLLGPDGLAEDYPRLGKVGNPMRFTFGVGSHERKATAFRLEVWYEETLAETRYLAALDAGAIREEEIAIVPSREGERRKVEFRLYRVSGVMYDTSPYRRLHLWIEVLPETPSVPIAGFSQESTGIP